MRPVLPAVLAACVLAACASTPPAPSSPRIAHVEHVVQVSTASRAVAHLAGASGSLVSGTLTFLPMRDGVHVTGDLGGLTPGSSHGFHVHQTGDCSAADASSAGGHFNPDSRAHGYAESAMHHAGDIDNVVADTDGVAHVNALLRDVSLGGGAVDDIAGRAIVVHAQPDDYRSQPAGNSGPRIACGVIGVRSQ
ncbi:MAG: superoxide dismutase family protein [Xanthomonadaceae bacterium]|nr:superoxide dismutase family protein [Xanthomonadaceae bacterium]